VVRGSSPTARQVCLAALLALVVGLGVTSLIVGFSSSWSVRLIQGLLVFGAGVAIIIAVSTIAMLGLANWRNPESEQDFEALVQRTEALAALDSWGDSEDYEFVEDDDEEDWFDPHNEEDFKALVRSAIDELPLEFHRALEHVAIVVSDGGSRAGIGRRRSGAYGLYQGDTVARDYFHDRIVIFRDTLVRDFGHDPELLKAQVTRTVRHELAHHLGWGEKGVRGLGL
jgi:predicted Zn-dependent protease with MMP-like domain